MILYISFAHKRTFVLIYAIVRNDIVYVRITIPCPDKTNSHFFDVSFHEVPQASLFQHSLLSGFFESTIVSFQSESIICIWHGQAVEGV